MSCDHYECKSASNVIAGWPCLRITTPVTATYYMGDGTPMYPAPPASAPETSCAKCGHPTHTEFECPYSGHPRLGLPCICNYRPVPKQPRATAGAPETNEPDWYCPKHGSRSVPVYGSVCLTCPSPRATAGELTRRELLRCVGAVSDHDWDLSQDYGEIILAHDAALRARADAATEALAKASVFFYETDVKKIIAERDAAEDERARLAKIIGQMAYWLPPKDAEEWLAMAAKPAPAPRAEKKEGEE